MWWLNVLILLLAVPVGYLIAWMGRDELVQGRKYFRIVIIFGFLAGILLWLLGLSNESLGSFFLVVLALVALVKSADKNFVKD